MKNPKKIHAVSPNNWIKNYADYLFSYAVSKVNDHDLANDLVQETFLAGIKSVKNFKGESSERTWLIAILKRKIIDHYRRINSIKGKAEVRMGFYSDKDSKYNWIEEKAPQSWVYTSDKEIENTELANQLNACIDNLPKKQAVAFKMKNIKDFESEAICNELGISTTNLWVMMHRARTQLQKCMEKNWFK